MTLLFLFVHFSILKYCTTHSSGEAIQPKTWDRGIQIYYFLSNPLSHLAVISESSLRKRISSHYCLRHLKVKEWTESNFQTFFNLNQLSHIYITYHPRDLTVISRHTQNHFKIKNINVKMYKLS